METSTNTSAQRKSRRAMLMNRLLSALAIVVFVAFAASRLHENAGQTGTQSIATAGDEIETLTLLSEADRHQPAPAPIMLSNLPPVDQQVDAPTGSATETPTGAVVLTKPEATRSAIEQVFGDRLAFIAAGADGFVVTGKGDRFGIGDDLPDGSQLIGVTLEDLSVRLADATIQPMELDFSR